MFHSDSQDSKRVKINFMIKSSLVKTMQHWIPAGERSDFVNGALEYALKKMAQKRAIEAMDKFSKEHKWKMTDAQVRKAINYGRK